MQCVLFKASDHPLRSRRFSKVEVDLLGLDCDFRCPLFERAQAHELSVGVTFLRSSHESQPKDTGQEEPEGFQQLQAEPTPPLRQAPSFGPLAGKPGI